MIFDSIKNKDNYQSFPLLYQALCCLEDMSADNIPFPGTILIKDQLLCSPVTLTSKPEHLCRFEAHRKYIDLHYIISGTERIATADINTLSVTAPYDPVNDIEFLDGSADGYYNLKPGQFMVCFPADAHKPAIMTGRPCDIQKMVFKIQMANTANMPVSKRAAARP